MNRLFAAVLGLALALASTASAATWLDLRIGESRPEVLAAFPNAQPMTSDGGSPALKLPDQQILGQSYSLKVLLGPDDRLRQLSLEATDDTNGDGEPVLAYLRQQLGGDPECHDNGSGLVFIVGCEWDAGGFYVHMAYGETLVSVTLNGEMTILH